MFWIKPEFATPDHQSAGFDSEGLLVMEILLSSDGCLGTHSRNLSIAYCNPWMTESKH